MELDKQDYNCNICYKLALNAYDCAQKKCKKLFCGECIEVIGREEGTKRCPFCRHQPFHFEVSKHRGTINAMKQRCKHCKKEFKLAELSKHQEKECIERIVVCRICKKKVKRKDIVAHHKGMHSQKRQGEDALITHYHSKRQPVPDPTDVIRAMTAGKEVKGKVPQLGMTGKFYCEGKLEPPSCQCCNGYCGPTNGQNCLRCMEMDLVRRGLTQGELVNAKGSVCWRNSNGRWVCGVMYRRGEVLKHCGKDNNICNFCKNLNITQARYVSLFDK